MHPDTDEEKEKIKKLSHCIPLFNEFVIDGAIDGESFKAIYNAEKKKQRYKIAANILKEHLNYLRFTVKEITSNDSEQRLRIPKPGILFLVLLNNFLSHADITEIEEIRYDDTNGKGSIKLELKFPKVFKIALEASPKYGTSIEAFKKLLSGDIACFHNDIKLSPPEEYKIDCQMGDNTKKVFEGDSGRKYPFSGLTYKIDDLKNKLIIEWK